MPGDALFSASPHVTLIQEIVKGYLNNVNTIIPGKVTQYNKQTGRAKVQPLSKIILNLIDAEGKNQSLEIPSLDNIPVCFFGSPSVNLTHEVKVGDTGLLLVSQRSIDEFKAAHLANPETPSKTTPYAAKDFRKFDINDSLFFPIYFSGNKDFQGIKAKGGDVQLKSGEVELGAKGNKAQMEGPGQNVPQALKALHDRVDKVEGSVMQTASSSFWTAAALPLVIVNSISGKILSRIGQVFMNRAFAGGDALSQLRDVGSKLITGIDSAGNFIIPDPPPIETPVPLSFGIEHQEITQNTVTVAPYLNRARGWFLSGTNSLITSPSPDPIFELQDEKEVSADFSLFSNKPGFELWSRLIGVYIQGVGSEYQLSLVWRPNETSEGLDRVSGVIISMEEIEDVDSFDFNSPPAADMTPRVIGDYRIPTGSRLTSIPNPHASGGDRGTNILNLQGLYLQNNLTDSIGTILTQYQETPLFASDVLLRPVMFLYFFDENRQLLTLSADDFGG